VTDRTSLCAPSCAVATRAREARVHGRRAGEGMFSLFGGPAKPAAPVVQSANLTDANDVFAKMAHNMVLQEKK